MFVRWLACPKRLIILAGLGAALAGCSGHKDTTAGPDPSPAPQYTITQTLSDTAQFTTIAFDGLGFLTGNLGSQSFLPPGKVADYSGFQYLRDNDPTNLGHNTSFVTIIAFNVLHILTASQISQMVASAQVQAQMLNDFACRRFPLMEAFRRELEGDLPPGTTGLDSAAVTAAMADLYRLDGQIAYGRARLMGGIIRSLSSAQRAAFDALSALNGVGNWNQTLADPLQALNLDPDVSVAVMTYASEMYAWYAGSIDADVYFCPERQGSYFGSFYLKDWPAMGNPAYSISEQLTGSAGQNFLAIQTPAQAAQITRLLDLQRDALQQIVDRRRDIAMLLRGFQTGTSVDSAQVAALSAEYGALDGELAYWYTMRFTAVANSLSAAQRAAVDSLANELGYVAPRGAFLYSAPIPMPTLPNTDSFFSSRASASAARR